MTTPSIDCYSLEEAHKPSELYDHLPLLPSRRCIRVLDLSSNPKRLLPSKFSCSGPKELVGTLRVVNLDDCPSFTALSYVWGSATPGEAFITCNSCHIPITTSCYQALAFLQPAWGKLTIWVDAICINQKNDEEKNVQIPLMQEIYAWARHVYIWLGPGDGTTKKHFRFLAGLDMEIEFPGPVPWHNGKGLVTPAQQRLKYNFGRVFKSLRARPSPISCTRLSVTNGLGHLDKFLDNNWLHRAWTFQEITLASSPVLVCGNSRLPWKKFIESMQSLTVIADNTRYDGGRWGLKILQEHPFTPSAALLEWQALVQIWLRCVPPDPDHFKSVGQVYHEFTTTLISWEPSFVNFLIDAGGAPLTDAPSWVPNFHTIRDRSWLSSWFTHDYLEWREWSREELQIKIEGSELSLKGAIIDASTPLVSALPRIKLDENGSLTSEAIDPFLRVVLFIYHWLAFVRRYLPIPKGYGFMSEGILDILHGPEYNFVIQEGDRDSFNALHRILVKHSTADDGIDLSKTPEAAITEITSEKRVVNYIVRLCNQVSGKRGLFVSQGGKVGSGPEQMAEGDIICIFEGVSAPMVLRKQGDSGQAYQVLGPALIGGLMDLRREQLEKMDLSWETIILV
ncbi:HET-domain-containing [Fusarium albosuccineum]|uniref:HET-domain-containing n=1 Tax=Fusarium albosuccineum TaxID=1237068 RepID=A0A8H4LA29_9HYPO|nr:HET-domain-containing [Fusarium albosuccineum]